MLDVEEPLIRRPEDDRLMASPAVGILMLLIAGFHESFPLFEQFNNGRIRLLNLLAVKLIDFFGQADKFPLGIDGGENLQALLLSGREILRPETGGSVDEPRAVFHRDVIGQDHGSLSFQEGMPVAHHTQPLPIENFQRLIRRI